MAEEPIVPSPKPSIYSLLRLFWRTGPIKRSRWRRIRSEIEALEHWGIFDRAFYASANPDVAQAGFDPLQHYVVLGASEARDPHPLFDTEWYLAQNPDVAASGFNPLLHYLNQGWRERRDPHPLFDGTLYLQQNPDIAAAETNPLVHYVQEGWQEGRNPHPLFANDWYLQHSPGANPLIHYLRRGWKEGRDPHPQFDSTFYFEQLADPKAREGNPLLHYLTRGAALGLDPNSYFDTSFYLERHPDLEGSSINPLVHYVLFGAAEGRWPNRWHGDLQLQQLPTIYGHEEWDQYGRRRLARFLTNNEELHFPHAQHPDVSIILTVTPDTEAHLFLLSLEAILSAAGNGYELVIADSGARDETRALYERGEGIVRVETAGADWAEACAAAVAKSTGSCLLFLDSYALVEPGAIDSALPILRNGVGAVGARVLRSTGHLEEAGSIIWREDSTCAYGYGDTANLLQYEFRRPVDYCSRYFLFTTRKLFDELGGFNARYTPACLEEADYCLEIQRAGLQVIYSPETLSRIYELSLTLDGDAPERIAAQEKFVAKWRNDLAVHSSRSARNVARARIASQASGLRILYFEDLIPHAARGAGYPRSRLILHELARMGHHVTCAAMIYRPQPVEIEYSDIDRRIELLDGTGDGGKLWQEYVPNADLLWVSRPHNLARLLERLPEIPEFPGKLIYDAEAIYTGRERLLAAVRGHAIPEKLFEAQEKREFDLALAADAVVVVSPGDKQAMQEAGIASVHVLGHTVEAKPGTNSFPDRDTVLFVGSVPDRQNPNADAIRYFCEQVWPELSQQVAGDLIIAGFGTDQNLADLKGEQIRVLGLVSDLAPVYNKARLFVAPSRYAAGIPLKVCEAAAAGVPCVVTPLIATQLGWNDGCELLVAKDARSFVSCCRRLYHEQQLWEALRENALERVQKELSAANFSSKLAGILASVT